MYSHCNIFSYLNLFSQHLTTTEKKIFAKQKDFLALSLIINELWSGGGKTWIKSQSSILRQLEPVLDALQQTKLGVGLDLTQVAVMLLREAVKAKVCQSSTETHTQAEVVEVPVDRSLLAIKSRTSGSAVTMLGREETVLFSGSLDKVT